MDSVAAAEFGVSGEGTPTSSYLVGKQPPHRISADCQWGSTEVTEVGLRVYLHFGTDQNAVDWIYPYRKLGNEARGPLPGVADEAYWLTLPGIKSVQSHAIIHFRSGNVYGMVKAGLVLSDSFPGGREKELESSVVVAAALAKDVLDDLR